MDTEKVYNENAGKWLRLEPESLSDFTARPALFDACGDLNGRSVLDLGCGEGYCARQLKRRGAGDYVGVDLSSEMIAAAKQQESKDRFGIEYHVVNVLEYVPERQFDLCIAVFLFNYLRVEEMRRVFTTVWSALNDGGEFVFCVPHPFFAFVRTEQAAPFYFAADELNYFESVNQQLEGEIWKRNGDPLHVQCVHKTFSDYFTALKQSGFENIPEISELTVTPELAAIDAAFFSPLLNVPLHVLLKITK